MVKCVGNQSFSILGDLNSDLLNPTLVKFCKSLSLCQLVQEPTRITSVSSTLIDVIVTNMKDCFTDTAVHPFSISDHHLVSTQHVPRGLKSHNPEKYITWRQLDKMTDEVFQKAMSIDHLWDDMLGIEEIDDCLDCFNTILSDLVNVICPVKKRRVRAKVFHLGV